MAKPKAGAAFTYSADEQLGTGPEAIQPGQEVTVREVVDAATSGAHDSSEDSVVVETAEGRAWSVGLDTFASDYTPKG